MDKRTQTIRRQAAEITKNQQNYYFKSSRPKVFYKESCSEKLRKIHKKVPVPESFGPAELLKKRLRYFLWIFRNVLEQPFTEHVRMTFESHIQRRKFPCPFTTISWKIVNLFYPNTLRENINLHWAVLLRNRFENFTSKRGNSRKYFPWYLISSRWLIFHSGFSLTLIWVEGIFTHLHLLVFL